MKKLLLSIIFLTGINSMAENAVNPEDVLVLTTKNGEIHIQTRADLAPNHVKRIKELAREKFYDGIVFHRVIDGFMAQTGDPTGTGTSGSGQKINAEFSEEPFVRGTLGMARSGHPDSADSQFFIMFDEGSFLNGQYTVWGQVIKGMDVVDQIKKAPRHIQSGSVTDPDKMLSLRVLADVQKAAE